MLSKISNITLTILISIYVSLINADSGLATNVGSFSINSGNKSDNYKRDQKDCSLDIRCQRTIKRSTTLVLVNSVYKHIGSIYF